MHDTYDKVEDDAELTELGKFLAEEWAWEVYCQTMSGTRQVPRLACNSILLRAEQTMDPSAAVWSHVIGRKVPRLGIAQFREDVSSRRCGYVFSKHPKVDYPLWFGRLGPDDDSAWTEGVKEEDMRERARQCWGTLIRLASQFHVQTRDGRFWHAMSDCSRGALLMPEDLSFDLRAHAGIACAMTDVALGVKQGFRPGDQIELEVSVRADGSCTYRHLEFQPAPTTPFDASRRPFTERLLALPSQAEWENHLRHLDTELSAAQKHNLAWTLVKESNDPARTGSSGWWKATVDRGQSEGLAGDPASTV